MAGVRHADVKGYSYSRGDVSAKSLANAYSQGLGNIFTQDIKPFEVEVLVCEVGEGNGGKNEIYHILYDGTIEDEKNYAAMGGQSDEIRRYLKENFKEGLDLPRRHPARGPGPHGHPEQDPHRARPRGRGSRPHQGAPEVPPHPGRGAAPAAHPGRLSDVTARFLRHDPSPVTLRPT